MNRTTLPISEILVEERFRNDLGDINELAESLQQMGLIQPIVVNQDKRLVAGGRRLAAATQLGWPNIDVVYIETLSAADLHMMELEENVRRKDMSWQERCLLIAKVHSLHFLSNAREGKEKWVNRHTAELIGLSATPVRYNLVVAKKLAADKDSSLWQCESLKEAYLSLVKADEMLVLAEQARRQKELANQHTPDHKANKKEDVELATITASVDLFKAERERYESNPLNTMPFDTYWAQRLAAAEERKNTIYISSMLHHADATIFNLAYNDPFCDHIITDWPYGIEMDMLDQADNPISNIEDVKSEHDVEDNEALFESFFPVAFDSIRPGGFFVTWCDIMQWQYMYDLAIKTGFAVQRWPFVWCKLNARNMAHQYNLTKATEIAMVCRKPGASLATYNILNWVTASIQDATVESLNHPFAKPFAVWEPLIRAVSHEGQLIWEPFAGRGSGVLALLKLNRSVIATEVNHAHYCALLENVKNYYRRVNKKAKFV